MIQEGKETLLKDLCARLPYGTMVKCNTDNRHEFDEELSEIHIMNFYQFEVKPYLRPMSSMTEEEKRNYHNYRYWIEKGDIEHCTINMIDWLNAHHFDYRGLIEKGLALEAPEGMYNV